MVSYLRSFFFFNCNKSFPPRSANCTSTIDDAKSASSPHSKLENWRAQWLQRDQKHRLGTHKNYGPHCDFDTNQLCDLKLSWLKSSIFLFIQGQSTIASRQDHSTGNHIFFFFRSPWKNPQKVNLAPWVPNTENTIGQFLLRWGVVIKRKGKR